MQGAWLRISFIEPSGMMSLDKQRVDGGERLRGMRATSSTSQPIVSLIIPTYNCHGTIEKAILSVLSQGYSQKELIVVDGGSSDGTVDILRKYDGCIDCWVSESDEGIYDAMNKGIDLSHGDWLYFLGSDDSLSDNLVLQKVFSAPTTGKMIYGDVLLCGDGPIGKSGDIYDGKFTKRQLTKKNICQQAIFYHKSLFVDFGKFDIRYKLYADWVFNMKIFSDKKTNPEYLNKTIAYYSTYGLSSGEVDQIFYDERAMLLTNIMGLHYYLYMLLSNYFRKFINKLK